MNYTKKHFVAIAALLHGTAMSGEIRLELAQKFARMFAASNPLFDRTRFIDSACDGGEATPTGFPLFPQDALRAAAVNALEIAHQMPAGWLDRRSVFDPQRDDVADAAALLAAREFRLPIRWEDAESDWESTSARLASLIAQGLPVSFELVAAAMRARKGAHA